MREFPQIYLKEWLEELGMKQAELAEKDGTTQGAISNLVRRGRCRRSTRRRIEKLLGLPQNALLYPPGQVPTQIDLRKWLDDPTSVLDGIIADEALKHTIRSILYLRNEK